MAKPELRQSSTISNPSLRTAVEEIEGNHGISFDDAVRLTRSEEWAQIVNVLQYRRELLKEVLLSTSPEHIRSIQGAAGEVSFLLDLPAKLEKILELKDALSKTEQPNANA